MWSKRSQRSSKLLKSENNSFSTANENSPEKMPSFSSCDVLGVKRHSVTKHSVTAMMLLILWLCLPATAIQLPSIANVVLVPRLSRKFTTIYNSSCDQCLCLARANASDAVNCFPNNSTCQIFAKMPVSYRLQSDPEAILYFTNGAVPAPSQCCMPNTTLLIEKLQNAASTSIQLINPRCLTIDDHGFLVTVQELGSDLSRFDPHNLTLIDTTTFPGVEMSNIAYQQGAYFLGTQSNSIVIVDSTTLSVINTMTVPGLSAVRDMIFLNDGQTMVVASASNKLLFFFNRSSSSTRNYAYMSNLTTSFIEPHGLTAGNDTLFYATSWGWRNVYSFVTSDGGVTWSETLFIDTQALASNRWGAHVTIDDCQRFWFSTRSEERRVGKEC